MSIIWILEKPTSAYAIFVSFALMAASILGTVMTLLEDHIIIVIKPNATGATPAPSPAKQMAELSPSPSSGDSCPNEGESMEIIAFLLFGYCLLALFCSVLMILGEFYRQCCMENIDSRLGFLTSNYGKSLVNFIGGTALLSVGVIFHGPIGPGDVIVGNLLFLGTALVYVLFLLNLIRQCCGVAADGEAEQVYFSA